MDPSKVLAIIGVTSLGGFLAFLVAYYRFPPNLSINRIVDKLKLNYESRIQIKNIGNMPAYDVHVDVEELNVKSVGISVSDLQTENCGHHIPKISSGEMTEIPACPHVLLPAGINLEECKYTLRLEYIMKLPFVSKKFKKYWQIELRLHDANYTWQFRAI